MYCSALDYLNSQQPNDGELPPETQNVAAPVYQHHQQPPVGAQHHQQYEGHPFLYGDSGNNHPPQAGFSSESAQYQPFMQNPPMSPLDAMFYGGPTSSGNFAGSDFHVMAEPVIEIGSTLNANDQFLLPAFTTIFQQRPTDPQRDGNRPSTVSETGFRNNEALSYSELTGALDHRPEYANLVASSSTRPSSSLNKAATTSSRLPPQQSQQQASGFGGLLSPIPASDLYYDSFQPYYSAAPFATAPASPVNIGHEASLFSNGFFNSAYRYEEDTDQQYQPQQNFAVASHDAAVDTADLPQNVDRQALTKESRRKNAPVGSLLNAVPSSTIPAAPLTLAPRPFKCSLCQHSFSRQWTLRQHTFSHVALKLFFCPLCGKSFARRQNAAHHLSTQHRIPRGAHCLISSSNIDNETATQDSTFPQMSDGSYRCPTCNLTFNRLNLLTAHMTEHSRATYCCLGSTSCRKRFSTAEALIDHFTREHHGGTTATEPLDCSQCSATFCDWQTFLKHLVEHIQCNVRRIDSSLPQGGPSSFAKRRYKCLRCYKTFTSRLALARHGQSDSHSHTCTAANCGRIFSDRRKLERHVLTVHTKTVTERQSTDFRCEVCSRTFATTIGLSRHRSRIHGVKGNIQKSSEPADSSGVGASDKVGSKDRISCPFRDSATRPCGSMFDKPSQLEKHMKRYHRKRGHRKKKSFDNAYGGTS